ncbi:unnamed protein product [Vitrella brassicaformis CCMP3155]|uniref:Cryptochrome DASH n=2 Tax=Vitrella brassicaformis TaxID=1169539 RepID=A0A0G4EDV2_VITBC|nr:unnamed protein product [Vitrella brassicaformis CCMP3155]|eukprot:CEL94135.1 unnamed protein product [Vitrella brassicaformis CCMP3155]
MAAFLPSPPLRQLRSAAARSTSPSLQLRAASDKAATPGSARHRVVVWFRNDLRLHDHPGLSTAIEQVRRLGADKAEVLPVFCIDPRQFGISEWGSPKTGIFRARFLVESVADLKRQLRGLGSDLLVAIGQPETILPELATLPSEKGQPERATVVASEEVTSEETAVQDAVRRNLRSQKAELSLHWSSTLHHIDDIRSIFDRDLRTMPTVFTPFRTKVEARLLPGATLPTPQQGDVGAAPKIDLTKACLDASFDLVPRVEDLPWAGGRPPEAHSWSQPAVLDFRGGEEEGLKRLSHYVWSDHIATYFDTRNGMLGADYSSKLSPWLAHGCLSPRRIYEEVAKYESERVKNKSTYWLVFELLWRDYFRFFALKNGRRVFQQRGIAFTSPPPPPIRQDGKAEELLDAWKNGQTGVPLVDANMRELAATGFMSNRGRQNVGSFLALDLCLDWRYGADHFESLLLDYDVCSNWGNWVAIAGRIGGRLNRFNIPRQARTYDPQGEYVRVWCPELRNVPTEYIFEPWTMPASVQQKSGCVIGVDYPQCVVGANHWPPSSASGGGRAARPPRSPSGRGRGGKKGRVAR